MKKIMLLVFLFAMLHGYSAYADIEGDYLSSNSMEGWNYFYDDGQTSSISSLTAHSGNKSLEYLPNSTDNFQLNTNLAEITGDEKLYYKLYIKNRPTNVSVNNGAGITICAYTGTAANTTLYRHNMEPTGKISNGWEEYALLLAPEADATNTKIYIQVLYTVPLDVPLYFDDITIQAVPCTIEIKDAAVRNSAALKLDTLKLKGYNIHNNAKVLSNSSDFTSWRIINGNATIDADNNLYYADDVTGTVTVEGNYLGVTAQTEITFIKSVGITLGDGCVNVTNDKTESIDVSVITALFDDNGKLYKCVFSDSAVPAGDTENILIPNIVKPFFIDNNNLKVFAVAGGNMKTFDIVR